MCTLCRQTDLETQMHVEMSLLAASLALVEGHCALLNDRRGGIGVEGGAKSYDGE